MKATGSAPTVTQDTSSQKGSAKFTLKPNNSKTPIVNNFYQIMIMINHASFVTLDTSSTVTPRLARCTTLSVKQWTLKPATVSLATPVTLSFLDFVCSRPL